MDLEGKLIGHCEFGNQPAKPFEGSEHGPYVITVRAGSVLYMHRDRTTEFAHGMKVQDVERMIKGGNWGIMAK